MKPHKWAKEIKAWADGADIEQRYIGSATTTYRNYTDWHPTTDINWDMPSWEYRIKPQEQQSSCCCKQTCSAPKEPQYLYVYKDTIDVNGNSTTLVKISTVKLNIDRYIGKIKLEQ